MSRYFPSNPYPISVFPLTIRNAIQEVITNIQAPDSLIGMAFLTTMSAAAQGQIRAQHPITGKETSVSLFLCAVADSGERKSTVDNLVNKPLREFDEANEQMFKKELGKFNTELLVWKELRKELLKQVTKTALTREGKNTYWDERLSDHIENEPSKPRHRILLQQNISERAFLESLDGDGNSVAVICDEGDIILQSPLLNKLGVLNSSWEGSTLSLNRANGMRITARNSRVTLSMMVQSSVFLEHIEKRGTNARGTGFFARFLMAWPQSTQGYRFAKNEEPTWEYLTEFHNLIRKTLQGQINDHPSKKSGQITYKLDEDAKVFFVSLLNQVEQLIQPQQNLSDIHDFASKTGEIILRIAALFHHFGEQLGEITCDTLQRAMTIVNFHLIEFQRIFSPEYQIPQHQTDAESIIAHLNKVVWRNGQTYIPKNEIYRRTGVRNHARFNAALDSLCLQGIIVIDRIYPSKTFYIFLNHTYFQQLNTLPLMS